MSWWGRVHGVLHDLAWFPDLTIAGHLHLMDPATDASATLERFGVGDLADRLAASLSSGQLRRSVLATVLVRHGDVLLLDEPEQRLDDDGVARLADVVVQLRRERRVVMATVVVGGVLGAGSHLSGGSAPGVTLVWTGGVVEAAGALELLRGGDAAAARRPSRPWHASVFLVRSLTSGRVAVMLPLLALPAGVGAVWGAPAAAATVLVATFVLTARAGTALDAWVEHPALRRAYAGRGRSVPALLVASTASLTVVYAAAGAALASLPLLWVVAATGFALLGTLRRVAGRSLIGESGPLLATPAGPIPVGVGRRLLAGNDALALALVAGLGLSAPVAAVAAVVVLGVAAVRGR